MMRNISTNIFRNTVLTVIAITVLVFSLPVKAAEVRAFVDRRSIAAGESLRLTVSVAGASGTVDVTPIKDFKVISRGTSTNVKIINGRFSRETAYTYTLIPLKEGRLRIPPLSVLSDGDTFKTLEIIINVSRDPRQDVDNKDVSVESSVSNSTPFEGQQIVYTFKFYHAVQIANAKFQQPDFSSFSAKEIDERKSYTGVFSGREYNVTELKFILIPLSAGRVIISPAILSCDIVRRVKGKRDPFFGRTRLYSKVLRTQAIEVDVKPLPEYQGQVKFSGLVGKFDISSTLESIELSVGDSTTLSITIEGTGNIMDVESPEVEFPETYKIYADNPEEDIHFGPSGYSGKKTFRFALVPTREGHHTFPPIQLRYFDVSEGQYQVLSSPPLFVTVHPAEAKDTLEFFSASAPDDKKSLKKKVEFTGRDILPLKEELDALSSRNALGLIQFLLFISAPVLCFLAAKAALALSGKNGDISIIMAQRAEKALKEAHSSAASKEAVLSCLYRALVAAIFSQAGVKGESLTYAEAQDILRVRGFSAEISARAAGLLERIEAAKFGGIQMDNDFTDNLFSETKEMIRSLSK